MLFSTRPADDSGEGCVLQAEQNTLSKTAVALCGLDFDASAIPMWVFHQETLVFLAVNDAALRVYGYTRHELLKMSILDIRPGEDVIPVLRDALSSHESRGALEHWRHRNEKGEVFEVELTCHDLLYEGQPARLVTSQKC